jgi:hypothetical protein
MVWQSCQQHIPAGFVVVVVVVAGAHRSSQLATQAENTIGFFGHCEMHVASEPPGQSSGVGDGAGAGANVVVVVAQSSPQTPTQTS